MAKPCFEVHPSVVYQLGESLITDDVQALIEIVKNSYDADATYAKVTIDTKSQIKVPGSRYNSTNGQIIIEDDGFGMDYETMKNCWLLISARSKLALKQSKQTTPGGRTPLGDKGLGRLGVQRLGEYLEVFTKAENQPGYYLGFSWLDFATAPSLQKVDIHLEETEHCPKKGTKIVISNLREITTWKGQTELKKLQEELSRMISPYKQIRDFYVYVEVDGTKLELVEISEKVRDLSTIRYTIKFDGKKLSIIGRARLDFFCPDNPKEADEFAVFTETDKGARFFDYLQKQKKASSINLCKDDLNKWFVKFYRERQFTDIDKLEHTPVQAFVQGEEVKEQTSISATTTETTPNAAGLSNKVPSANPGPFNGEVDAFDLGGTTFKKQSVFDRISDYRKSIKDLSGIRVYRDGFAIRVDRDWLKLGAQWTSASSYSGLKLKIR